MSTDLLEAPAAVAAARKPRRQVAKSTGRPAESKRKTAVVISDEMKRRLDIEALMTDKSASEVVEELIRTHVRKWVVSDRGSKPAAGESDDQSTLEVSAAA